MTLTTVVPLLPPALAWHRAGVCVLPAAPDGSKRPAIAWAEYQTHLPHPDELAAWLGAPAYDGIGLICGAVSGNLEMFELEAGAVDAGLHIQLRDLFHASGFPDLWAKLQTYVERSPAGGLHWVYRVDGPVPGNTKLARHRGPDGKPVVDMETRGEGGWVITAPSAGRTHPSGKAWMALPGCEPGVVATLTADEHLTLHRLARTFDSYDAQPMPAEPTAPATRRVGEKTPGDDYNQRTDWADLLVPAGWTLVYTRGDGSRLWRRPGKRVGISATTGYGDQGHDLLYVFTTSTEFESERSYSKLGAFALLHHGGDFAKAASELRRQSYGDPLPERERPNPLTLLPGGGLGGVFSPFSAPSGASEGVPGGGDSPKAEKPPEAENPPSWARVDLTEYLDGSHVPQVPELMPRLDGHFLLYRGRVHSFHGESESGKSWLALAAVADELNAGHDCLMVDFESDAHTTVGRLLRLGVAPDKIRDHFDYRRPEQSPMGLAREFEAWAEMLAGSYAIAILDGVTEALAVFGVASKDNDEVTAWIRTIPRKLAATTGAAVILVDHVTKDADSRGRFAIGGQAKMAALDGAAYVVEVIDPLGVGLVGRVSMRVAKDRPGGVRPHSGPYRKTDRTQESAVVTIDSTYPNVTAVRMSGPRYDTQDTPADERRPFQPTGLMQQVSKVLENAGCPMSRNAIDSSIKARREYVMQAIDCLVDDDYVIEDGPAKNGGRPTTRLLRPYREDGGPVPVPDPADLVPPTPSGGPVPVPRTSTGKRRNGSSPPSLTRSGNQRGTGWEQVGPDGSVENRPLSEDSETSDLSYLRIPMGTGPGLGPDESEDDD